MSELPDTLPGLQGAVAPEKRSPMACTHCRQVKLRCDATRRFPAPCSRCQRQGKICRFDPAFKRKPTRGALEKVTEERDELRRLMSNPHDPSTQKSQTEDFNNSPSGKSQSAHGDALGSATSEQSIQVSYNEYSETGGVFQLDDTHLDATIIRELIDYFSRNYLCHLPILDLQLPIGTLHSNSPLLFWTLILISARDHQSHRIYGIQLRHPHRKLLSECLLNPISSIYTVQALLLLCTWPAPVRYQKDDPSWGYCGLAVAACLQLGLHEIPGSSSDGLSNSTLLRLKTWLGCFLVSTRLSSDFGIPPLMASVTHMEAKIRQRVQDRITPHFLHQLELQRYSVRAEAIIRSMSSSNVQNSLIDLIEHDITVLEGNLQPPLNLAIEIDLLAAKLRLYALPLLAYQMHRGTKHEHTLSRAAWYKGFSIAVALANIFMDKPQRQNSTSPEHTAVNSATVPYENITFYPKHYFGVLVMAGMYLLKLLVVDRDMSARDKLLARSRIKQVQTTLKDGSQQEMDEKDRAARMIQTISDHVEDATLALQDQTEEERPIPSIIGDGIETAKIIRQMRSSTSGGGDMINQQRMASLSMIGPSRDDSTGFSWDDFPEWNAWLGVDEMLTFLQPLPNHSPQNTQHFP